MEYEQNGMIPTEQPEPTEQKQENTAEKRERITMPIGAAIACILVVALMIGAIIGGVGFIKYKLAAQPQRQAELTTAAPETTAQGDSETTDRPSNALEQVSASPVNGDEFTLIDNCMNAVVSIDIMVKSGYSTVTAGSGSGVIISPDGCIVTCNHVVEDADKIYVYLNDGTSKEALLIGRDVINDLAVIKIEGSGYAYAVFGDSSSLRIGEGVFAIGNAIGVLSNTYTSGCISGLDRTIKVEGQEMTLMQTDAAINHGNSGGGLFRKSDGALIGIVNAKSAGESIEGLGFAIPSNVAAEIVRDLMDYGFVTGRPYLGISTEDVTLSGYGFFTQYYTYPQIVSVEEGSPAEAAGLKEGDIILSIEGISISGTDSLIRTLNSYSIGETVNMTVLRNRQNVDITVTLGERALPTD